MPTVSMHLTLDSECTNILSVFEKLTPKFNTSSYIRHLIKEAWLRHVELKEAEEKAEAGKVEALLKA